MEPPPFYHHRYVPPSSENPSLYNPNSHHRLPPPAQLLPLPPPPPLPHHSSHNRPSLPLPPPAPAPSQFSYPPHRYPIQDRPSPGPLAPSSAGQYSSNFIPPHVLRQTYHVDRSRDPSQQNRHRSFPYHEENSNLVDRWSDFPPPPRVPTEPHFHQQHQQQQRRPLSPTPHFHQQQQRRPLSPTPRSRMDDYERKFRYRDGGFRDNGNRETPVWGGRKGTRFDVPEYVNDDKYRYRSYHEDFGRNSSSGFERDVHRIDRDVVGADSQVVDMVLSSPTGYAPNVRSYNDRSEDLRRDYSRLENDREYIDGDGVSLSSRGCGLRRESLDSGYVDMDRENNKMAGHVQEFFNRSPRKTQVHKKSALLRIQAGKANNKNNYRNRSHDNSRYSRPYYDDSNLSVNGSFRGKERKVLVNQEGRMDGEREKSPMELDVSFKSNALVAKAIKTPSNSGAELESNLAAGNRKVKKSNLADCSRYNFNNDSAEVSGSSRPSSSSDKSHEKLKEKIVAYEIDSSTGGLGCLSRSYQHERDSEKKSVTGETESCPSKHDFLSGSDKDLEQLAEKMSASNHGSRVMGGSTGKDSVKSICSDQGVKRVASDAVLLQRARKRKPVEISRQNGTSVHSVDVNCEFTDPENHSAGSLSATSQLEEGFTHLRDRISLAGIDTTGDVISPSQANELCVEGNIASKDVDSHTKEDGFSIGSSLPVTLECSTLTSGSSNLVGDTGSPNLVDEVANNECSRLSSDGGLAESQNFSEVLIESKTTTATPQNPGVDCMIPCLNEPLIVETSLVREARISVHNNVGLSSLKENKVHDCNIDASTTNHELDASKFDQGFCRSPENVTVVHMDSANVGTMDFYHHLVINGSNENYIIKGCPKASSMVSLVGPLDSQKLKTTPACEGAGYEELPNDSPTNCSTDSVNSLGTRTSSDLGFLGSKQTVVDGESTLPGVASVERSPTSMFFNSVMVGRKRKVTDDQLDVHVAKASNLSGSADDQDESSILQAENHVSVEKETVHKNGQNTFRKYYFEEGLSLINNEVEGSETEKEFSLVVASPVLSEFDSIFKGAVTSSLSEPSSNIEKCETQTADIVADSCQDETSLTGLSSHSEATAILLQKDVIAGQSYCSGMNGSLDQETSYQPNREADVKEDEMVVVSATPFNMLSEGCKEKFVRAGTDQKQAIGDTDCANDLLMENMAAPLDIPSCATSSTDRQIDSLTGRLSNMGSPEDVSNFGSDVFINKSRTKQVSDSYQGRDNMSRNPIFAGDQTLFPVKPSLHCFKIGTKSGVAVSRDLALESKTTSSVIWNPSKVTQDINPFLKNPILVSNRMNSSVIKSTPSVISTKYSSAVKVAPSSHIAKPRTWHRNLNASCFVLERKLQGNYTHAQTNSKKDVSSVQSAYVRRGNSLVRKLPQVGTNPQVLPSRASVYRLNSGIYDGRKGGQLDIDTVKPPSSATLGGSDSCSEKLRTAPVIGSMKSSSCRSTHQQDLTFFPLADPLRNDSPGETNDPFKSADDMDTKTSLEEDLKSSEADQCETGTSNCLDGQSSGNILYFKIKSNQLVAASNTSDSSLHNAESSRIFSDNYFKRRKNQLIRTSLNKRLEQRAVVHGQSFSSLQQGSQNSLQIRSTSRMQSNTVAGFTKRKFSLVWTLNGALSSNKDGNSGRWHRVRPYLFPWKRPSSSTYMQCLGSFSNDSLAICQKLQLSRKREAIYKRSVSGFSLRRSKVLGVGGRNLKWSKSIERNSRKANTEATLAVAAAAKRKKAQNMASFTLSKSRNYVSRKSGHSINLHSGERIFRIGSERYKMDPTRRTLHRISDERNSFSDNQPEKKTKKLYVPRRLLIGNDEYVRIGNGNQLVRDPKRRIRILANEKVRWSLHTARLRLARKKMYCQFFTRFGKCNKGDKNCPYIHDPSKIAVCTKFLNGSCSNPNCQLTHKVIPERMQDCSYFLQGLCSNETCPYRHVNVNPKSPVCEGFVRGYCADGNECPKKHTHVCPAFEATGSCPQISECKLHHPKKKRKGVRRASNLQKNARGRYFGSAHVDSRRVCETITGEGDDSILNMEFGDYICLDVRIEGKEQAYEARNEPVSDNEGASDVEMAEVDEQTKPIRIMHANASINFSPTVLTSSEMTTS